MRTTTSTFGSRVMSATTSRREKAPTCVDSTDRRIKQPFQRIQPAGAKNGQFGQDLLDQLFVNLRRSVSTDNRPAINVVVGPAGMGKSVLFESLNARLFNDFQDNKRAGFLSP
ncbi:hypothetical protein [Candidatus Poriferisodalis sp.]|uniref:hypothetical protein n=1 Tax=Candidatus Poriferisodalis sp. TaxID=3101277 RepID=UPI003B5CEEAA